MQDIRLDGPCRRLENDEEFAGMAHLRSLALDLQAARAVSPVGEDQDIEGPVCSSMNFTRFIAFADVSVMVLHGFEGRSPSKSAENKKR